MRITTTIALGIGVFSIGFVTGCTKNEHVQKFEDINAKICACKDAECALKVHGEFTAAKTAMDGAGIDWSTSEGKKLTKDIEVVWKGYMDCMNPLVTAKDATTKCQADDGAMGNSDKCKACCESNGRIFKYWNDPAAGALVAAMGGGDLKGCACK
jgi:hypothetical protein